jgi:hypothetical protein
LGGGALLDDDGADSTSAYGIILVLFICEELERVDELTGVLMDRARRQGSVMGVASASYSRAWARLIAGRVGDALEDGQQAVDAGRPRLADVPARRVRRASPTRSSTPGDVDGRRGAAGRGRRPRRPGGVTTVQQIDARGPRARVRGRHAEAAADFLAAGEQAPATATRCSTRRGARTPGSRSPAPARSSARAS